jgi:hypothetical protein
LEASQKTCLEKEKESWKMFTEEKRKEKVEAASDKKYLDDLLSTNSTKAAHRLRTSVKRKA